MQIGLAAADRLEIVAIPYALYPTEREFFFDNLLVRILVIVEMILVDRPCAMGV